MGRQKGRKVAAGTTLRGTGSQGDQGMKTRLTRGQVRLKSSGGQAEREGKRWTERELFKRGEENSVTVRAVGSGEDASKKLSPRHVDEKPRRRHDSAIVGRVEHKWQRKPPRRQVWSEKDKPGTVR